jgi:hypothetical protein
MEEGSKGITSPGPCLLWLEEYRNSRVVEPRKENKIGNVSDMFVHTGSQIENETGGIRHIPKIE